MSPAKSARKGTLMVVVVWLVFLASACWAAYDSSQLRSRADRTHLSGLAKTSPVGWFLGVVLIWIVAFPAYLIVRPKLVQAAQGPAGYALPYPMQYAQAAGPQGYPPPQVYAVPQTVVPRTNTAPPAVAPPTTSQTPSGVPTGAPVSPDGYWWWDGAAWQPVPR